MHNYLPGFTKQFDPEEGELIAENWTAIQFLKWLESSLKSINPDRISYKYI